MLVMVFSASVKIIHGKWVTQMVSVHDGEELLKHQLFCCSLLNTHQLLSPSFFRNPKKISNQKYVWKTEQSAAIKRNVCMARLCL